MRSEQNLHKYNLDSQKSEIVKNWQVLREKRVFKLRILRCVSDTWKLAIPVVISRIGTIGMSMCDTIFVGRYSTDDLAYQSIGNTVSYLFVAIAQALLQGTIIHTANAYGQGNFQECGQVLRKSIPYGLWIGFLFLVLCLPGEFLMNCLGQPVDVAKGSAKVLAIYGLGIPFFMYYFVLCSFLEGTKRPLPGMVMILIANVINIVANYVFVFGHGAFPALGAMGSAISTTIIRVFLAVGMFIVVYCIDENDEFGVWRKVKQSKKDIRADKRKIRHVGYGAAFATGVEEGAYAWLNIMAGWLGAVALGAFTIMSNVTTNVFVLASGVGTASSVLMGIARGKKSIAWMKIVGYTGLFFNALIMLLCSAICYFCPKFIVSIYSTDQELIQQTIPLIVWSALMCLFDGSQLVMVNVLRGAVDITIPTICQAISFLLIMLPCVGLFTFQFGWGILGMVWAMILSCSFSAIFLVIRFYFVCRRYEEDGFF